MGVPNSKVKARMQLCKDNHKSLHRSGKGIARTQLQYEIRREQETSVGGGRHNAHDRGFEISLLRKEAAIVCTLQFVCYATTCGIFFFLLAACRIHLYCTAHNSSSRAQVISHVIRKSTVVCRAE